MGGFETHLLWQCTAVQYPLSLRFGIERPNANVNAAHCHKMFPF